MTSGIRPATDEDLQWIDTDIDPDLLRRMEEEEIDATVASRPTPPHWRFPDGSGAGDETEE
jgi:hypothetical protein